MKRIISAAAAVLLLSGCANSAATTEMTADTTSAAATTAAETTTTTTATQTTTAEATTTTTTTTTTAETTTAYELPPSEMTNEYKLLYGAFLRELIETELINSKTPRFDLYDFDGDGVPELFVSADDFHSCGVDIYTVSGGEIIQLIKGSGSWGEAIVSGKYLCGSFYNMGAGIEKIYEKSGDELVLLVTLESAERWNERDEDGAISDGEMYTEYRINEETVSEEEYNAELKKYPHEWESVGRKCYYNEGMIAQIFGAVPTTDECKALYKALITDIADSDEGGYIYGKLGFEFYDLDDDGTPEMFISSGPAHTDTVKIYTVSNGEVKLLGEELGSWGQAQVYGKRLRSAWFGGGVNSESYYVKNGDSLDVLVTFENKDIYEPEEYFINGEEVTKEEYESEQLKYFDEYEYIGRKYYVGKKELELIFG